MDDHRIERLNILLQQQNYREAERQLSELLREQPNNVDLLSVYAELRLAQDDPAGALEVLKGAIGLAPAASYLLYLRSRIESRLQQHDAAEVSIRSAISLDPTVADYSAWYARLQLAAKDYGGALELADRALALDAEHLLALNTRSTALLKLDKAEASFTTIEGALRGDPNNAYTHANYGWGLLEGGQHEKALGHFKESLKNDPSYDYAQVGMLQAIKANNFLYRLFLKYAFWIGNLTAKYQWGVIIGFYVGFRLLRALADNVPALQPVLYPLLIGLAVIAFSTWIITPISNLFLRLDPYGKYLLDKRETLSANLVGLAVLAFVAGLVLLLITGDQYWLALTVFGFGMMPMLGVMFSPAKSKLLLPVYTGVMAVVGALGVFIAFSTGALFNLFGTIFLLGVFLFQWVANYQVIGSDGR